VAKFKNTIHVTQAFEKIYITKIALHHVINYFHVNFFENCFGILKFKYTVCSTYQLVCIDKKTGRKISKSFL